MRVSSTNEPKQRTSIRYRADPQPARFHRPLLFAAKEHCGQLRNPIHRQANHRPRWRRGAVNALTFELDHSVGLITVLKANKKAIFTASSKAAQAVDYLDGLQPAETVDDADELEEAACGQPLSSFRLWKG